MRLRTTITAAIAFALCLGVGVAAAAVVIYSNDFSTKPKFRSVQKFAGGKPCRKFFRDKKSFGIEVMRGPLQCEFRTPVSGDSKEPDHEIEGTATLLRSTARPVRRDAYVGVALRADESSRYELRVFPQSRSWELRRRPARQGFPIEGTETSIGGLNKANKLKLRAFGNKITAFVNKARVVDNVTDPNPSELNGRRTLILGGNGGNSKQSAEAFFSDVRIRIP
jgi:hypothetical protein